MVRVFLGYHSELIGVRLVEMFHEMKNVDLTGFAYQSATLLSDLDRYRPDVAVLDVRLLLSANIHDLNGLKMVHPHVRFILLYDYPFTQYSKENLRFGAEYCFDIHHEFANLGKLITQPGRPSRYEAPRPS